MSNDKIIKIKELNLDSIRPNGTDEDAKGGSKITIIGKAGSGKSVLIKHLLYVKQVHIPTGLVISGSEDSNNFYKKMFPNLFIYNSYNDTIIENFAKRQKFAKKFGKKLNNWSVLIMDDCMHDLSIFKTKIMTELFKNGRHWNMLAIFANQYVFDFPPSIRTNIDGVFIFREMIVVNREKIWKHFASVIPSFKLFCQLMDELTNDYTCIYINNQIQSNEWTDCVFYIKADIVPDFKFGCKEYQQFAEIRQAKDEDEEY